MPLHISCNNVPMTYTHYTFEAITDTHQIFKVLHTIGVISYPGNITLSGGMTLTMDSDLSGASPQFNLTCISTGGPATTVTWIRDNNTIHEGTETVLDDRVTAQYTHTLTVTGRLGGLYTCIVANDKPSEESAWLNILGKPCSLLQ